ncbi:MAG: hypothetical protein WCW93_00865 [Candidatus Paceibacterota bacterium]
MDQDCTFVKRVWGDRRCELAATDGKETLAEARDVFMIIDSSIKPRVSQIKATPVTPFTIYRKCKDGTHAQVFSSFGVDMKKLLWEEESQIIAFSRDYREIMIQEDVNSGFFFPLKDDGGFSVVSVFVRKGGLSLHKDLLSYEGIWKDDEEYNYCYFSVIPMVP